MRLPCYGEFEFKAAAGFFGQTFFRIKASDGQQESLKATVYVQVDGLVLEAKARGSWSNWTRIGGLGTPVPIPAAWVGEAIDLRVVPFRRIGTIPTTATYQWTLAGDVVAGWSADITRSYEKPFNAVEQQRTAPTVYWVDAGDKEVRVTVDLGNNHQIVIGGGDIPIKRPKIDVTSSTYHITAWPLGQFTARVEFGNKDNPAVLSPNKEVGIEFTLHPDVNVPAGSYQWVQLLNVSIAGRKEDVQQPPNYPVRPFTQTSGGWVLDTGYPYGAGNSLKDPPNNPNPYTAVDSPFTTLSGEIYRLYNYNARFQMYAMWKFGNKLSIDSIWVPLRVTDWYWRYQVHYDLNAAGNINGFVFDVLPGGPNNPLDDHSMNPPSQDTTTYPKWTSNSNNIPPEWWTGP